MAGRRSKQKGNRREREVVALLKGLPDVQASRIPLSGAVGGDFAGDIRLTANGLSYRAEVKARAGAEGWQKIKKWLGTNDILFLVEDRSQPLVVLSWPAAEEFLSEQVRRERGSTQVRATVERNTVS